MKMKEKRVEKVNSLEEKVIQQIAQTLVFVAKEIYQKEKESNMPTMGSAFFNIKNDERKNNRNRICANKSK